MNKPIPSILLGAALLASVPWTGAALGLPSFYESFLYLVFHWMILALSWNILSGYSGYFSFGHGAFFGVGMYTTAYLAGKHEWSFLATLPLAIAIPAALGLVLGAIVFRVKAVRGELFALLTLAVTFVVGTVILNTRIDGGPGISLSAVAVPAIGPSPSASFYLMALLGALLALLLAYTIKNAKLGTGLFAIHDDEDVAEVMGVPTRRYKLVAFAISSGLAGLAGGIHALFVSYVTTGETFTITVPLTVVLMSVLGGTRYFAGPAVGALVITCLLYFFTAGGNPVAGKALVGLILVVVILFMPNGILGYWEKIRSRKSSAQVPVKPKLTPAAHTALSVDTAPSVIPANAGIQTHPHASMDSRVRGNDRAVDGHVGVDRSHSKVARGNDKLLLEVKNLSKSFTGVQALDGVNLQIFEGEILGLLGPNGSGKSTFINVVTGHFASTGGQIWFAGRDITALPAHRVAQSGIARTYQIPRPFAHLTVRQNVALVAMFGQTAMNAADADAQAMHCLAFTGLEAKADALPSALNLHERKFLELARALAAKPRLVMLDEVLSGLTPSEINTAVALIRKIRDQGATIVFVEHVMHAVMALTDRVAVLHHGQLLAVGLPKEVMQNPAVMKAYLGTDPAENNHV